MTNNEAIQQAVKCIRFISMTWDDLKIDAPKVNHELLTEVTNTLEQINPWHRCIEHLRQELDENGKHIEIGQEFRITTEQDCWDCERLMED